MQEATETNVANPSFWQRYKQSINFREDLKGIFVRSHDRHAALDGVRAMTILLMVLFHVLYGIVRLLDDNVDTFIQEFPVAFDWLWLAQGSDPLFVVCGLLVGYTCFREHDKTGTINVVRFYKWRVLRILPLYLIALLIFLPTDDRHYGYLVSNLFFVSNFFDNQKPIVPVGWSLEAQMQFYFLLPWICFAMYKLKRPIIFLVGLCVIAVAYRYWLVISQPALYETPFYQIIYDKDFARLLSGQLYYDLDARIAAFLFGMLAAYVFHYHGKTLTQFFHKHKFVNTLVLALGLLLIYWSFSEPMHNREADFYKNFNEQTNIIFLAFNRYAYSLGMCILIVMVMSPVGPSRILERVCALGIWYPFAQLIYPIYLFHFPFLVIAALIVFQTTDKDSITHVSAIQVFMTYAWAVLFTVLFSIILHIYVEKPFNNMRSN